MQKRTASVLIANVEILNTVKILVAIKDCDGVHIKEFQEEYSSDKTFHGVRLLEPSETEKTRLAALRAAFHQGLVDNISSGVICGCVVI